MSDSAANEQSPGSMSSIKLSLAEVLLGLIVNLSFVLVLGILLSHKLDALRWVNVTVHSTIEAAGALAALLAVPLLVLQWRSGERRWQFLWSASAFLCMGVMDMLHAFLPVNSAFVWTRTLGILIAGSLFASVWVSSSWTQRTKIKDYLWPLGALTLLLGIFLILYTDSLPVMLTPDGRYTPLAIMLNSLGGLGFLSGAVYFGSNYLKNKSFGDLIFTGLGALFGFSGIMLPVTYVWGPVWWFVHFLRLGAYLIVFQYLISSLRQIYHHVIRSNAELEQLVQERTSELSRNRAELEASFQSLTNGVMILDQNGQVVLVNDAELEIFGITADDKIDKQFASIETLYDLYDQNGQLIPFEQWPASRVLRGESIDKQEFWIRHRGSAREWCLQVSGKPVFDENWQQILSVVTTQDITEMKRANSRLRESESRFRDLADSMPQVVWIAQANGEIEYVNRRWYECTGLDPGGNFDQDLNKAVPDEDLNRILEVWNRALLCGEKFELEYRIRSANGSYRWYLGRAVPVCNESGKVEKWYGTATDIHDQKLLLEQVKEGARKLSIATNAASIGTWEWDLETNRVYPSEIFLELNGMKSRAGHLHPEQMDRLVVSDDRNAVSEKLQQAIQNRQDFKAEYRIRQADGTVKWINSYGRATYDDKGKPLRMFGVSVDVTERKELEERLLRLAQQAREGSELRSAFLANMSHEIRTPLGAMMGFMELVRDPTISEPEKEGYFEIIRRNGEQLSHLINDILDLSKIEAGQLKVETLPTRVSDLVAEVISSLEETASKKQLHLTYQIAPQVPEQIGTDPTRLRQILWNLIGNAIKFTHQGAIRILVNSDSRQSIRFCIEDTGIGMSDDQVENLFQSFSQADASMTRKYGGTGLGLVLSKRFAQALGGDLTLKSSVIGRGSVFEVKVENKMTGIASSERESRQPVPRVSKEAGAELQGVKVLLVEDSVDNQMFLVRMLSRRGAVVKIASNGLEGIRAAESDSYDVVLMDLQMPVMDGYSATSTLRARGFTRPILALTAHALDEFRQKCREVGFSDFVTKPVKTPELAAKIAEALSSDTPQTEPTPQPVEHL